MIMILSCVENIISFSINKNLIDNFNIFYAYFAVKQYIFSIIF